MRDYTSFIGTNGREVCRMSGTPKNMAAFEKRAENVEVVEIGRYFSSSSIWPEDVIYLRKVDGRWQSGLNKGYRGYFFYYLKPLKINFSLVREEISEEEGHKAIKDAAPELTESAAKVIVWCDKTDETDEDGRYWLSAYQGAGVYRLVVAGGKIRGAIRGGFHDCRKSPRVSAFGDLVFKEALKLAVEKELGTSDFHLLKADGSGTYFFLRNQEDSIYLETKEYDVPMADGTGWHHNIEIKSSLI